MVFCIYILKKTVFISDNNNISSEKTVLLDCKLSSDIIPDFITETRCLIQPVITLKTLNEMIKVDSSDNTSNWNIYSENTNQKSVDILVESIRKALDYLMYILFDGKKLIETVTNWNDDNNLIRYFAELVTSMGKNTEFIFICRDHVMIFVQNTAFKILDNHHLYSVSFY